MSENSQVKTTSVNDIARLNHLLIGNSITGLRIGIKKAKKRIIILEKRLVEMRANEAILKARYYSTLNQAYIDGRLSAGSNTMVDAKQSFDPKKLDPKPNADVDYTKYQIYAEEYGIKEIEAEINKINAEIQEVMTRIEQYNKVIVDYEAAIKLAEQNKSQNVVYKAGKLVSSIGSHIFSDQSDLEKDAIAKSKIRELLQLQQICMVYLNYTTDPRTNERRFPDEEKLSLTLARLRQVFWAHCQDFPELLQDDKEFGKINFQDPGSQSNIRRINKLLSIYRGAAADTKITQSVDDFIKNITAILNDKTISRGINRTDNIPLPNSTLKDKTFHFPSVALSLGSNYIGSFELPSLEEAIKKTFKIKSSRFIPLPVCPNIEKPPKTTMDVKNSRFNLNEAVAIDMGANKFREALIKSSELRDLENQKYTGLLKELPYDAPKWVYQFISLHQEASYGEISYSADLLPKGYQPKAVAGNTETQLPQPQPTNVIQNNPVYAITPFNAPTEKAIDLTSVSVPPNIQYSLSYGYTSNLIPLNPASLSNVYKVEGNKLVPISASSTELSMLQGSQLVKWNNGVLEPITLGNPSIPTIVTKEGMTTFINQYNSKTTFVWPYQQVPETSSKTVTKEPSTMPQPQPQTPAKALQVSAATLCVTRSVDSIKDSAFTKARETMLAISADSAKKTGGTIVPVQNRNMEEIDRYAYQNADGQIVAFILWGINISKTTETTLEPKLVKVILGPGKQEQATVDESVADSLKRADDALFKATGQHIKISYSYRSYEQQDEIYRRVTAKGGRALPAGTSFHERGLAIDVINWQEAQPYLNKEGWLNKLEDDKGHFSVGEFKS